ncbi:MAG: PBP1A family penicillin-binding protein [Pseudobdellovibrio sp.]
MLKKVLLGIFAVILIGCSGLYLMYLSVLKSLPEIIKVEDYKPLLVSQVYDRNNKKFGEFFRERRVLIPYKDIPKNVVNAFLASEDDQFFQHSGINPQALLRAALANMKAGRNVQGGSTITQQVAKTLLLSNEKTLSRKLRDILLALQMEKNLSKDEILYLYLNQIYFGQGAYGIEMAAQTYFKKSAKQLTLPEAAMLAGLPKAPSDYSPVKNPSRAKERQIYVLRRMADVNFIKKEDAEAAIQQPIVVNLREDYEQMAPFYLETVRQLLIQQLGEDVILDQGVKVYTSLDLEDQKAANLAVIKGLKELDRRQGFRGPLSTIDDDTKITEYLEKQKRKLITESNPERTILPDGNFAEIEWHPTKKSKSENKAVRQDKLPSFIKIGTTYDGIVTNVNDALGTVEVQLPETKGLINFETMTWARKPNFEKRSEQDLIRKPSQALKKGDVILVKISGEHFSWPANKFKKGMEIPETSSFLSLELDQEPIVEGSLLSIDQQTEDVLAMVGGYSFARNEFNRALQAARQTGSSFKAIVYAAAIDKGYTPSTQIIDAPIIYKQAGADEEGQGDDKIWKPSNHGHEYNGEITMRNALVRSLNIPSVKIMEDIGVPYAIDFAQRLGVFSKLNPDFTLVLGSSSLTLFEMTKVFSQFGRMGLRTRPKMIKKVLDRQGKVLIENVSLDSRFLEETKKLDDQFEEKRKSFMDRSEAEKEASKSLQNSFYFDNPEQLIRPQTAFIITNLLKGVVEDPHGTGGAAASLGRELAAKTGTTNGYVDAWFLGYTPNIATGVWVGFDKERTLGKSEVGGKAALPIWLDYMKEAHTNLPILTFPMPAGVNMVKIDADSGKLATSATKRVINQAYIEGSEPTAAESRSEETTDHLKQDIDE